MAQSPVSSPNSSSGYHPTLTQAPKSYVFSSLYNLTCNVRETNFLSLLSCRDKLYENHIKIKPDKIQNFIFDCTMKATKPEDSRAILCALLTIRDQSILPLFFDFLFIQPKPHEFSIIIDNIYALLLDTARKYFQNFSSTSSNNILKILSLLSESKNTNIQRIVDLSNIFISAIDSGSITSSNNSLIEYFMHHTRKFQQIWPKLDFVIPNLIIKFLRFYQDIFLINPKPTEKNNLTGVSIPSDQIRSISASTSSIPTFNDNSAKSKVILQKALSIGTSYENFLPTFFNIGLTNNTISKFGFKEIDRILHDPRTFQKMSTKFPSIYKQLNTIPENFICCFTEVRVTQLMLPYKHLKEMLNYNKSFTSKTELDYPLFLKRDDLFDIDLILSDAIRTFLQNNDFIQNPYDIRFNFILNILYKGIEKGAKLSSSLHALVSDFFFVIGDLMDNPDNQKKTLLLVLPAINLIQSSKFDKLASSLIEMILMRLKQTDFSTTKINSVRLLFRFLNEKRGVNMIERVNMLKHLNDKLKDDFNNLLSYHDNNDIPSEIVNFTKKSLPLDSQNGISAIIAANEKFHSLYVQHGSKWGPAIPSIKKIFDSFVPSSRKGIETLLDMTDIHATTPCMSYNLHDAQILLKFVSDHQLYQDFDEALEYTDPKFYVDALVKEISSNIHPSRYSQFLISCRAFRKNVEVLKTICDFCPMSLIIELADLPYLDVGPEAQVNFLNRILSICSLWSNDSQTKLTVLLNGIISTPQQLMSISDVILKTFEQLPSVVVLFFQNMIMMRADQQYAHLMQKLNEMKSEKAQKFCCLVLGKWHSKNANTKISRTSLVPDVII